MDKPSSADFPKNVTIQLSELNRKIVIYNREMKLKH